MAKKLFQKGQSGNPAGGTKGKGTRASGAGRKPEWFRERMRTIASSDEACDFLEAVVRGDPIEEKMLFPGTDSEKKVMVTPSVQDRLKAWEKAKDAGYGKDVQPVEMTDTKRFILVFPEGK